MADRVSYIAVAGASVGVLNGVVGIYTQPTGNTVASFTGALVAFLVLLYKNSDRKLFDAIKRFREYSQRDAARVARLLIVALGIGGTLLAIDAFYQINVLWGWLDPLAKRAAPALVVVAIVSYGASIVSNAVYRSSKLEAAPGLRLYEFLYYAAAFVLSAATAVFCLGAPIESFIDGATASMGQVPREDAVKWISWPSLEIYRAFAAIISVAVVWTIAMFLCVISRQTEWVFKDRDPNAHQRGVDPM